MVDVRIDEMHTRVDAVDGDSLLTQQALDRIVRAVIRALENDRRLEQLRRRDIDLRSINEQQNLGEA